MSLRCVALLMALAVSPSFCADWNAHLAERYLDDRLKEWAAWPNAVVSGVVCVSCHSGLPYLVARPALRQSLGEKSGPTLYEDLLVEGTRATVFRTDAKELFGGVKGRLGDQVYAAQSVVSSVVIAMEDAPRAKLSPEGEKAFERMWSIQLKEGPERGAWLWSDYNLDPWETKDSVYYGAALGALATGLAPADYQSRPEIRHNVEGLTAYLRAAQGSTPLHNRLFLLWASSKLHGLLPGADKAAILAELQRKQEADGGWTLASLGPWGKHDQAPPSVGSNSYATALTAFALEQAGRKASDPVLSRALAWLQTHQNSDGSWPAESMNHKHDAGTVPARFMSDAATGYATAALLGAGDEGVQRTVSNSKPRH
jgi:squalene-hopene/tetraprenyl-beta-curcumene cyclase